MDGKMKPRFIPLQKNDVPRIVKERLKRGWMNLSGWRVVVHKRDGQAIGQYAALVKVGKRGDFVGARWFYADMTNG